MTVAGTPRVYRGIRRDSVKTAGAVSNPPIPRGSEHTEGRIHTEEVFVPRLVSLLHCKRHDRCASGSFRFHATHEGGQPQVGATHSRRRRASLSAGPEPLPAAGHRFLTAVEPIVAAKASAHPLPPLTDR
jgi:hypothetical protein